MRKIIYSRPDGGVSIVSVPVDSDQALAAAQAKLPADAANVQIVAEAVIPLDRTFRNAWVAGDKQVMHDMEKCRAIHRDHLRTLRAPLLAALDAEYLRADERGDVLEKQRIAARKQALRDAPADPSIDAARTPEELKAAIPAALNTP